MEYDVVVGLFKCTNCESVVEDEDSADHEPFCSEECQEESDLKEPTLDDF